MYIGPCFEQNHLCSVIEEESLVSLDATSRTTCLWTITFLVGDKGNDWIYSLKYSHYAVLDQNTTLFTYNPRIQERRKQLKRIGSSLLCLTWIDILNPIKRLITWAGLARLAGLTRVTNIFSRPQKKIWINLMILLRLY